MRHGSFILSKAAEVPDDERCARKLFLNTSRSFALNENHDGAS